MCRRAPPNVMAVVRDIAQVPAWNESAYFVDGVHQTAEGTKILASILARTVN